MRFTTSRIDTRILTTDRRTRRSDAHRIAAHGKVKPMQQADGPLGMALTVAVFLAAILIVAVLGGR